MKQLKKVIKPMQLLKCFGESFSRLVQFGPKWGIVLHKNV